MRRFKQLTKTDRLRIEAFLRCGLTAKEIAVKIGVHISTIYREVKRGQYEHLNSDWTREWRYSPDIAEEKYQQNMRAKGPALKIGNDRKLAEHIEKKIIHDKYSPAAVLGEIRRDNIEFTVTISIPTLYSYIDKGIFLHLTNKNLPDKCRKKRKYRKTKVKRPPRGESIENRPPEVDSRETFGFWEMDTVKGKKKKSKNNMLVLTERKTRQEIQIKIPDGTMASVVRALDMLERKYGDLFPLIFKSITVDNGSEFYDEAGMTRSCLREGARTKFYFCHPYSSYERGSNEKQNRMIRRFIPKGTDFDDMTDDKVEEITAWLNNYPRGIFNYYTSQYFFDKEIQAILTSSQNINK